MGILKNQPVLRRVDNSPEVSLLSSIFKKKMVITFVLCSFAVATITGYIFNFVL